MTTLTIIHTNDLHSELDRWSAVSALIKEKRSQAEGKGHDVLLFDLGDHSDRFHPLTEGLAGKGNTELLNEAGYHAVTIGNNEGMTFAKSDLDNLYHDAEFDVLLANLFDADNQRPSWSLPWKLFQLADGKTAAVIGVTIPFYVFYKELGWTIKEPFEVIAELLPEIEAAADVIICLSHLGLREDEKMTELFPQFDLILGAHTHQVLEGGRKINNTWIHQCGRSGSHLGEVSIDMESMTVSDIQTHVIDTKIRDAKTENLLNDIEARALPFMKEEIAYLPEEMNVSWYESSALVIQAAEALREWCDADVAMFNAGLLLRGLPAGTISKKHLHELCPHPINPAKVSITGEELIRLINQSNQDQMVHYPLRGYGFRGKVLGICIFTAEDWQVRSREDIHSVGKNIVHDQLYTLALPDLYTFSHLYPQVTELPGKGYYMPEFLRDVLAWKLAKVFTIN